MAPEDTISALPDTLERQLKSAPLELKSTHSLDPIALKQKYLEERNKRLHVDGHIDQYRPVTGPLAHYADDPWVKENTTRGPINCECEVLIVGGGYGGELVAVKLLQAGITDIRIVDKAGDFGGTWYWNRYPGAQCDVESYVYMPLCEEVGYIPTEKYAHAKELFAHAQRLGRHFGLYEKAIFHTEVHSLHWDCSAERWTAKTNRGDRLGARFVITATGLLHRPKMPGIPGIESFQGHSFHSSRWDYNYTGGDSNGNLSKLADKRVGIIGTGPTAVGIVPHLATWAKELYVFQRTPSAVDVRNNAPTDPEWAASLRPGWQRQRMNNFQEILSGGRPDVDLVADNLTAIFLNLLPKSSSTTDSDPERAATERQIADFHDMERIRMRVERTVNDSRTAESLKPYYNRLCKRSCFHDEYLSAFNRPNVHLIDTQGAGVTSITPRGVVADSQNIELDCIVYATGFEMGTAWVQRSGIEIHGTQEDQTISQKWSEGASTFHGWTTRGFPNCFFVSSFQATITINFVHINHEQATHLAYVISTCRKRNIKTIQPTAAAEEGWTNMILEMGKSKSNLYAECTPGVVHNEKTPPHVAARNATYPGGSQAFMDILSRWREDDRLEGLDIKYWNN
ncbi:hypothetical protein F5884DRAFT_510248 [Xylogone sp. PMI_703]|nr:hypothetical protein F5884DRAFT_510248 [Xylogone sp. PMI_703]